MPCDRVLPLQNSPLQRNWLSHKTMRLTKSQAAIIAPKRLMCLVCSCLANILALPFEDNAACSTQLGRRKKEEMGCSFIIFNEQWLVGAIAFNNAGAPC